MTDIEQQDNQFDLAKFSPTKADLELKLQEYAELKINGIEDGEGFELVKNAFIKLKELATK